MAKVLVMFYDNPEYRASNIRNTVDRKEVSTVSAFQDLLQNKSAGIYLAYYFEGRRLSYKEACLALGMKLVDFERQEDAYRMRAGLPKLKRISQV